MRRLFLVFISLTFSLSSSADDLLSLYQRALLASPELKGSQFALDITRAQEEQAFGKLLPQAALTGNYSLNNLKFQGKSADQYPGTRAGLSIRQPLFDLQSYLLMKSQQSRTAQGEENLLTAHQQLIFDLVDRYTDALEAADKIDIISTELGSTEKQLNRVKSMNERQMALITDLYELQARVETLRTNLIDSKNDANIALEKLRELTGDAVTGIQAVRLDATQPAPEGSIESWTEQVERNNPDLNALKHAVESADKSISAYQAGHLPRLELQASENYSNTAYNNQQTPAYTVGTVGVEATIPLYEGGITTARISEAEGRKGLSSSQLEQKQREIEKIARASYLDMTSSSARSLATDRQLDANEKAKLAMEKGYELGVVTIVDLLNAEKQLSESRKIQRQSRYRYFKARSNLLRQAGRLDVEELAKLNSWLITQPSLVTSDSKAVAQSVRPAVANAKPMNNTMVKPVNNPPVKAVANPPESLPVKSIEHSENKPAINPNFKPVIKPVANPNFKAVVKPVTNPNKPVFTPVIKPCC
jgi:outer membrane protein